MEIRYSVFFFVLLWSQIIVGQNFLKSTEKENSRKSIKSSIDSTDSEEIVSVGLLPTYEFFFADFQSVNSAILQKFGKNPSFSNLQFVGIGILEGLDVTRKFNFTFQAGYQHLIPQYYHPNDSVSFMLSGYKIPVDFRYDLLPNQSKVDLLVGGGFDFGAIKLQSRGLAKYPNYVPALNKFTALKLGLSLNVLLFKGVCVYAGIQYYGDFSNLAWENKVKGLPKFGNFSFTGLSGNGGLCLALNSD